MERCFKRIAALLLALMLLAAAMPVSKSVKAEPSACPEVADPDEEVTVIVKLEGDPVLKKCAAGDERAAKYREALAKKQLCAIPLSVPRLLMQEQ